MFRHFGKPVAALLGAAVLFAAPQARAQNEQFIPMNGYWVGPYAAGGSGVFGGFIDYVNMVNAKGGINGVKLTYEKCETEYNNARGVECYERSKKKGPTGASLVMPLSTGITYSLIDKGTSDHVPIVSIGYGRTDAADGRVFPWIFPLITTYWSQATAMLKFIGQKEGGGTDKLKGKKIVLVYHDSAYGKEPIPVLESQAKRFGYELHTIAVAHPGNEQQAQWLQVRQIKPDWVILWGWGVMNPTALKAAARIGFPRNKIVAVWWSGAEEDAIPAGDAAKGYYAAAFNVSGSNYPVVKEIEKTVYAKGKGEMEDKSRVGSIYYNRGVVFGIVATEAIRTAQAKFGKGKPMTGDQVRWGLEHLNIDDKRLKELGATGFMQALKVSCSDHEGGGAVKFLQSDGKKWNTVTDWIASDQATVRPMIEESAAKYAKEKGITPRDCSKEG
jgi:branched-chain amino acid transport system substrate-binding protein